MPYAFKLTARYGTGRIPKGWVLHVASFGKPPHSADIKKALIGAGFEKEANTPAGVSVANWNVEELK